MAERSPSRSRSRSRDRDEPEREGDDAPKKRRSRFSDAPPPGEIPPSTGVDPAPPSLDAPAVSADATASAAVQQAIQLMTAKAASFAANTGASVAAPPPAVPFGGLGVPPQRGPPPGEPPPPPGKQMGTVKNFNMEKGFGFIIPDGGGDDVFAHGNSLTDGNALREGSRVAYRMDFDHAKGKARAEEVTGAYNDPSRPQRRTAGGGGG